MRLPPRLPPPLLACFASTVLFCAPLSDPALAAPPSADAQATLRRGVQAASAGLLPSADALLTTSIGEWKRTSQPPNELSAIYKVRSTVRKEQGQLQPALADLDEAVALASAPSAQPDAAELQRTYLQRARIEAALERWKEAEADYGRAIALLDQLDAIESTNPYVYAERSAARSRLGLFEGAADDALTASEDFRTIGDKLRSLLASADASLALYGAGDVDEAVKRMVKTFSSYGTRSPASNNPDDIGLLQSLARREAELHLAYAAHEYAAGQRAEAESQWNTGCIRLESFVTDAQQRLSDEASLRALEAERAEASGKEAPSLRAASVAENPFNSPLIARLNGMDPESPFVTQRPQSGYIWYKNGEGDVERRSPGTPLAQVDAGLSCARYRQGEWLRANKPEWPPALVANAELYAAAVPQAPIVVPPKGKGLDRSECSVLLSRPGVGDAVPCFQ